MPGLLLHAKSALCRGGCRRRRIDVAVHAVRIESARGGIGLESVGDEEHLGQLFIRSSWEDDATWVGLLGAQLQMFRAGAITALNPASIKEPLDLEEAIVLGPENHKFQASERPLNDVFIVGLPPGKSFHLEIDDEEMTEVSAGAGGVLYLKGLRGKAFVRLTPRVE